MNNFERITKNIFQKFGILIRKYNAATSEELRRLKLLQHHHVDLVFDIGANKGQYAKGIIDAGYKGKIISFEPLEHVQQPLIQKVVNYFLDKGPNPVSGEDGAMAMWLMEQFTRK